MNNSLSHIDSQGKASMVNISGKEPMLRTASAQGFFHAKESTIDAILCGEVPKGEALSIARVAGIQAAKKCDDLIPLCHPLPIEFVEVQFARTAPDCICISSTVVVTGRTGIEMEALTAVSVAALTLWDMTKAVDTSLSIDGIRVVDKRKEAIR